MAAGRLMPELIARVAATIRDHEAELTALDQAIGDGDHGTNLRRGFDAVAAEAEAIAALPFGPGLHKAGMTLVMKIGGASGPLYGSALMAMGKAADTVPTDAAGAGALLGAGVAAIKARGRSDVGAKTMLDVLAPVQAALSRGAGCAEVRAVADASLEATRPMQATKGRAAFLGARSVGHLDPGARSSALIVHAVCDVLEGK